MLPEHVILIEFLNNRFDGSDLAVLNPGNWSTIVSEAGRHRIAPLIYSKIKQAKAEDLIPEDVLQKFREKYLANAYRNSVLFHQLNSLLAALNREGIPVILLKGAHLAEFVYKDIALRPMSDLDIMVKEDHLSDAVRIAFDAGYRFFGDNNPEKEKTVAYYDYGIMPHSKHFKTLIHPAAKTMLEIHGFITSESSPFEIASSELWQAAQPSVLSKNAIFLLAPEDLIIHLCLHAAYDDLYSFGMGALYDIAIVIKHYENNIDWVEMQRRSRKRRTNQCLALTLYFTQKWLGAKIPDEFLRDFRVDKMVQIAEERLFKINESTPLHMHFIQWRNLKGLNEKLNYIGQVLLPSKEYVADRYLQPKQSRALLRSYFFRFYQALKGVFSILGAVLNDDHYFSRLNRGDNDLRLREWLMKF